MSNHDQKIDDLAGVELFSRCSTKELRRLATITDRLDLEDGRVLCREGTIGHECFIVIEGTVQVSVEGRPMGTVVAGEVLGEMALLNQRRRVATAVTDGPVSVYVIHANRFGPLVEDMPSIATSMLRTVSDRLAALETAGQ